MIAQIEDLYMLVAPKQTVQYDAEKEEKYDLQVKQAALKALEEAHKKELMKSMQITKRIEKLSSEILIFSFRWSQTGCHFLREVNGTNCQ